MNRLRPGFARRLHGNKELAVRILDDLAVVGRCLTVRRLHVLVGVRSLQWDRLAGRYDDLVLARKLLEQPLHVLDRFRHVLALVRRQRKVRTMMEELQDIPVEPTFVAVVAARAYDLGEALVIDICTEQGIGLLQSFAQRHLHDD